MILSGSNKMETMHVCFKENLAIFYVLCRIGGVIAIFYVPCRISGVIACNIFNKSHMLKAVHKRISHYKDITSSCKCDTYLGDTP